MRVTFLQDGTGQMPFAAPRKARLREVIGKIL